MLAKFDFGSSFSLECRSPKLFSDTAIPKKRFLGLGAALGLVTTLTSSLHFTIRPILSFSLKLAPFSGLPHFAQKGLSPVIFPKAWIGAWGVSSILVVK